METDQEAKDVPDRTPATNSAVEVISRTTSGGGGLPGAGAEDLPGAGAGLVRRFMDLYPEEAAEYLASLDPAEAIGLLAAQGEGRGAGVLSRMNAEPAAQCLAQMTAEQAAGVLPQLELTLLTALIARLPAEAQERLLAAVSAGLAQEVRELMAYPVGTAGHLMDPRVFSFPPELTVEAVLDRLHTLRKQKIRDLILVDPEGRLVGAVPLPEVVMAEADQKLMALSKAHPPSIQALAPQEEVVDALAKSRLLTLPVVDINGKLIGVIRQKGLMQAAMEEATADMQMMVGVGKEERALSSPVVTVRKRLPWLNINLLTAFVAAGVVGFFENTIAQVTALAVLLPVVAGQSGNTGAQALAVTMRGLALREIRVKHWPKVMMKEAIAGTLNGVAIAVVTMIGVYIWSQSMPLCLVIGAAMVISMALAAIAGTAIPVVLTVLRQDPAQSSSIVLTTVTDVVGFFSFLGLATLFVKVLVQTQ